MFSTVYKMTTNTPTGDPLKHVFRTTFECKALHTRPRTVRIYAVRTMKKDAREIYFDELRYTSISESQRYSASAESIALMINEIEEMNKKL